MTPTIKEIARHLGLNPSTVSRALSGSSEVSESTRQQVIKYAKEINYTPNLHAKTLVGSQRNLIGCLVLEYTNPFFIPMIRAIEELAGKNNYITFFSESQRDQNIEKQIIDRFRQIRVAGVILIPVLQEISHLRSLVDEGTLVILAGRHSPGFNCVDINNEKAGYLAGKHLLELGHQKIGYALSGEENNIPEKQRQAGLREVLSDAGIELNNIFEVGNNRLEGGEQAGKTWLSDHDRPSAVFCSNDLLAMGFIHQVVQAGVQVPQDVAVIGHDDIPFADIFSVPLTTIAYPKHELGRVTMQILLDRLQGVSSPGDTQYVTLDPQLIIRRSSMEHADQQENSVSRREI